LSALSVNAVADVVRDAVRASADESLLDLAAKAHGSPFLLIELLRGLEEEGRLNVRSGLASAAGDGLPRRLAVGMQQRLDGLSEGAGAIVRVAATLPDRFSAALVAAGSGASARLAEQPAPRRSVPAPMAMPTTATCGLPDKLRTSP
jgi:predicted ATPase